MKHIIVNKLGYFFFRLNNKGRKFFGKNSRIQNVQRILNKNFKKGESFNFIQIGGNDGVSFDFLYDFVTERKAAGIVLEPVPRYYKELESNYSNYPNIKTLNKAMHIDSSGLMLYAVKLNPEHIYPDWVKGIASISKSHLVNHNIYECDIQEILVETMTGDELINQCKLLNNIDLLQIDTEGYDYKILLMLDLKKIYPKVIKFESVNLSKEEVQLSFDLMRSLGYHYFVEGGDTVAIKINQITMF